MPGLPLRGKTLNMLKCTVKTLITSVLKLTQQGWPFLWQPFLWQQVLAGHHAQSPNGSINFYPLSRGLGSSCCSPNVRIMHIGHHPDTSSMGPHGSNKDGDWTCGDFECSYQTINEKDLRDHQRKTHHNPHNEDSLKETISPPTNFVEKRTSQSKEDRATTCTKCEKDFVY